MKVIIAGGRDFNDGALLFEKCEYFTKDQPYVEIVSGGAKGADNLGKEWAHRRGFPVLEFLADWNRHNKAAGPIRNREMAKYADALIAFWDGKSRGTKNMIEEAKKRGLKVRIVKY